MEKHISKIQSYFDSNVPANRYTSTARGSAANIDSAEWNILSKLIESDNLTYDKKVEYLKQLLEHYRGRKSPNSPLPIVFRQAIYLLAYDLCKDEQNSSTAQNRVLLDIGLSHNTFTRWGMHPKDDYLSDTNSQNTLSKSTHSKDTDSKDTDSKDASSNDTSSNDTIPLTMPIFYQGKKNYSLVYMVGELIKQVPYSNFVDVFCGSGTVTLGIPKDSQHNYFMNDISRTRTNLIDIIRYGGQEFMKSLSELMEKIKGFSEGNHPETNVPLLSLFPETSDWKIIGLKLLNDSLKEKDKSENKEISVDIASVEEFVPLATVEEYIAESSQKAQLAYAEGLYIFFNKIIDSTSAKPLQRAIATVYTDTFSTRRKPTKATLKQFFSTLSYWEKVIDEFQSFNISTLNQYDYLAVNQFNSEDTLLYMDSPYAGTAGYKGADYTIENFQKLCDTLKNFKGKWIFSCRATVVYKSKKEPEETEVVDDVDTYWSWIYEEDNEFERKAAAVRAVLEMYRPLAPNVAFIKPEQFDDEFYFKEIADNKEVMFFNFDATAPDLQKFYNLMHGKVPSSSLGIDEHSVCKVLSYEEFYPLARKGLAYFDGIE